jgi:hypothetical protein
MNTFPPNTWVILNLLTIGIHVRFHKQNAGYTQNQSTNSWTAYKQLRCLIFERDNLYISKKPLNFRNTVSPNNSIHCFCFVFTWQVDHIEGALACGCCYVLGWLTSFCLTNLSMNCVLQETYKLLWLLSHLREPLCSWTKAHTIRNV